MAKFCGECGKEIAAGTTYCAECGAQNSVETKQNQAVYATPPVVHQPHTAISTQPNTRPEAQSKTVGMGTYFLLMLVFALPVIGLIACIIMSFAPSNKSIKNYARATVIWTIISLVLVVALVIVGFAFGEAFVEYINQTDIQDMGEFGDTLNELSQLKDSLNQLGDNGELTQQIQNGGF